MTNLYLFVLNKGVIGGLRVAFVKSKKDGHRLTTTTIKKRISIWVCWEKDLLVMRFITVHHAITEF